MVGFRIEKAGDLDLVVDSGFWTLHVSVVKTFVL